MQVSDERVYEAITISRKVGCGNIFCIFNEEDGEFYNLIIKGDNAKEAPCGESWFNAVGALLTYALRRSIWEGSAQKAIVSHLKNHRCTKIVPTEERIVSCSDAIGRMVLEYLKARGVEDGSGHETGSGERSMETSTIVPTDPSS